MSQKIPPEILCMIFQHVVCMCGSLPFLCRWENVLLGVPIMLILLVHKVRLCWIFPGLCSELRGCVGCGKKWQNKHRFGTTWTCHLVGSSTKKAPWRGSAATDCRVFDVWTWPRGGNSPVNSCRFALFSAGCVRTSWLQNPGEDLYFWCASRFTVSDSCRSLSTADVHKLVGLWQSWLWRHKRIGWQMCEVDQFWPFFDAGTGVFNQSCSMGSADFNGSQNFVEKNPNWIDHWFRWTWQNSCLLFRTITSLKNVEKLNQKQEICLKYCVSLSRATKNFKSHSRRPCRRKVWRTLWSTWPTDWRRSTFPATFWLAFHQCSTNWL